MPLSSRCAVDFEPNARMILRFDPASRATRGLKIQVVLACETGASLSLSCVTGAKQFLRFRTCTMHTRARVFVAHKDNRQAHVRSDRFFPQILSEEIREKHRRPHRQRDKLTVATSLQLNFPNAYNPKCPRRNC